ncbi:MAG: nucleoside hydrolase [Oscillospiraceae bacterium]|nr:nucleoside hydrolase [Oscillospiraceae bacterium]
MKKIPIIIDCDPGHDDAIALVLALSDEKLDVKAITVVGGNQPVEKTGQNTLRILAILGKQVPVAFGTSTPLLVKPYHAQVHGESGLDGPKMPEPIQKQLDISAVELLAKTVEESNEPITLVPTGTLMNIAIFLLSYPHLKSKIKQISMMGGSAVSGCSGPGDVAEFNVWVDYHASHIVFHSGIPIIMHGYDVTNKAVIPYEHNEKFREHGKVGIFVADLLDFFGKPFRGHWPGTPIHDACAIAWLIAPEIFETKKVHVAIDLDGEWTYGATVVDFTGESGQSPNAEVVFDIDRDRFEEMLHSACKTYEEKERQL